MATGGSEKPGLPTAERQASRSVPQPRYRSRAALASWILGLVLISYLVAPAVNPIKVFSGLPSHNKNDRHDVSKHKCSQPPALFPSSDGNPDLKRMYEHLSTDTFRNTSVARLSGAVRVRTESFDDLGPVGEDPRWEVMADFRAYLRTTFPRVHASLTLDLVNTHGLLYTWAGSDLSLKPTLLMAHQDTVPVPPETVLDWTHPPFDGVYDGTFVWGRGASDCKNQLIAEMEAVEVLLEAGFRPRRTVLMSFGFDEECSGLQGAAQLAPVIQDRYGWDGVAVIIDEGATFEKSWGTTFAKPGTAEKGYADVLVTVRMPGGHSSIPPDHTSIGVLSEFITLVEGEPYHTRLTDENPYLAQLQCGAEHSPEFPKQLKKLLHKREASSRSSIWDFFLSHWRASNAEHPCPRAKPKPDQLALEAANLGGPSIRYLMQTSQAVDIMAGGLKVNALPELATATINHRINVGDTAELVYTRLARLAHSVAAKHNLTVHAFDSCPAADNGALARAADDSSITLATRRTALPVAPVTPVDLPGPFGVLAGTTRALYGEHVVVAPGIMTGNTDTRYYWDLSEHIFRFGPGFDPDGDNGMGKIHTVDERVSVVGHVNAVRWFVLFIRNMDDAEVD